MKVVLDSNIFITDFLLKSPNWNALIDFTKDFGYQIIIPQVILDEVNNEYERNFKEILSEYQKLQHKINRHILDTQLIDITNNKIENYSYFIQEKLNFEVYPYINEHLPELSKRVIKRMKPAKKDGKDFRDTLIWLSLKDICKKTLNKQIIFISQNTSDFAGDNNLLHKSLIEESKEEEIEIKYHTSILSFINELVIPYTEALHSYNKAWLESNLDYNTIQEQLKDLLNNENWLDYIDYQFGRKPHGISIKYIDPICIQYHGGFFLPNGNIILNLDMEGSVYIEEYYIDYYNDKRYEGESYDAINIEFSVTLQIVNNMIIETYVNEDYSTC